MSLSRFKDQTLLDRLKRYDQQYYEAIITPRRGQEWGYAMRAYHAHKVANPLEWKIKEKAEKIADELRARGIEFYTTYLKLKF